MWKGLDSGTPDAHLQCCSPPVLQGAPPTSMLGSRLHPWSMHRTTRQPTDPSPTSPALTGVVQGGDLVLVEEHTLRGVQGHGIHRLRLQPAALVGRHRHLH